MLSRWCTREGVSTDLQSKEEGCLPLSTRGDCHDLACGDRRWILPYLTGNLTENLTGNLTGNKYWTLTGNLTGSLNERLEGHRCVRYPSICHHEHLHCFLKEHQHRSLHRKQ